MKLAIVQPYFFPYIGYFQLINTADRFVLLDEVQFIRHGWIERNRILKQNEGWLYIKVPLQKHKRSTLIKDIKIRNENWKQKIIAQLQVYKKIAPFYKQINELVNEILNQDYRSITQLNFNSLQKICSFLGIKTPISIFSELNLKIESVNDADEWALNISKAMNAQTYINPVGGREIFNKNKFDKNKIKLRFLESSNIKYNQRRNQFEAGLSIIDVMMFNTPEEIKKMLNNYTLI